jgi:hypothetical protein
VVRSKWIDGLEKEKEQAHRNDLQRESDLLRDRNLRLEAEIHADSHLNHTLKVCICIRKKYTCLSDFTAPVFLTPPRI